MLILSLPVFPVERCKGTKGLKTSGERRRRKNDAKDCFVSAYFKTGIAAKALNTTFAKVQPGKTGRRTFIVFCIGK